MSNTPDASAGSDESTGTITVYSDYVCPFCYLGRRSLETYQSGRETELEIDWRPFDLRAGKRNPDGTIDHDADDGKGEAYYERAKENVRRLQEEYGADGMELDLATDVDSLPAQLVSVAVRDTYGYDTWLDFDEAVFEALWHDGRDVGDEDVLADLAADVGVDPGDVREALADEGRRDAIREQFRAAQSAGISGVPTFVVDGHAARGAVPPEQLERLVEGT
ncbi:DsbA family oxidoreductase [Halobellus ruber]|uniref:DsbA family protein n=1 Tax=Halobellus ruber TaxID=2761102 RepID=A0A7J9SD75_9EURY|nr:DsbA family protein [Halobellus ruber]MBB6644865.1 DsbA family protein [Halobellus ruber]